MNRGINKVGAAGTVRIAIDGPGGAGKSTIAKAVAKKARNGVR